jgi:hypothetical protein
MRRAVRVSQESEPGSCPSQSDVGLSPASVQVGPRQQVEVCQHHLPPHPHRVPQRAPRPRHPHPHTRSPPPPVQQLLQSGGDNHALAPTQPGRQTPPACSAARAQARPPRRAADRLRYPRLIYTRLIYARVARSLERSLAPYRTRAEPCGPAPYRTPAASRTSPIPAWGPMPLPRRGSKGATRGGGCGLCIKLRRGGCSAFGAVDWVGLGVRR